ncbi:MAG: hypothetical protein JWM91_737 [Rhodospirillales bacterium]|nr:hypothetical protein [Rhodospirillales bacterium]
MKVEAAIAVWALAVSAPAVAQQNTELSAMCKDGTVYNGAMKSGACADHGGVDKWIESTTIAGPNKAVVVGKEGTGNPSQPKSSDDSDTSGRTHAGESHPNGQ